MEKIIIKIVFFLIVSYISAEYFTEVNGSSKKNKKYLLLFITLSYTGCFLPIYSVYESVFDMMQIVLELVIIFIFTDGKLMKKIYAYLWFNVFCMIGMAGGYVIYILTGNTSKGISDTFSVILYYGVYLVIVEVLCLGFIQLDKNRKQQMYSIGGIELSVIMGLSALFVLYALGSGVFNGDGHIRYGVVYGLFIYVLLTIVFIWIFNRKVFERDSALIKRYVEERYCKNTEILEQQLIDKEKLYGEKISRMKSELKEIYESMGNGSKVIEGILCEKKRVAKEKRISMEIVSEVEAEVAMATEDIVCVIGNLLDNAIRAAEGAKSICDKARCNSFEHADAEIKTDYDIYLNICAGKSGIMLTLENIYDGSLIRENDKLKSTKLEAGEHGLGLENVYRTLKKYGKTMDIETDEKMFRVTVK